MADTDSISESPVKYPFWYTLGKGIGAVADYADRPDPTMPMGRANPAASVISDLLNLRGGERLLTNAGYGGVAGTHLLDNTARGREARGDAFDTAALLAPSAVRGAKLAWDAAGPLSKAAGSPLPSTLRMFMGGKAAGADLAKRAEAEALEKAGSMPEDIWKKTGWARAPDRNWAWELSDQAPKYSAKAAYEKAHAPTRARIQTLADAQDIRAIMERGGEDAATVTARFSKQTKELEGRAVSPLSAQFAENNTLEELDALGRAAHNKLLAPFETTVGEIFPHEELFKNYPHLKDMKVELQSDKVNEGWGHFDHTYGIRTKASALDDAQKETILHELQHAVQREEGFDLGASPASILKTKNLWYQALKDDPSLLPRAEMESSALGTAIETKRVMQEKGVGFDAAYQHVVDSGLWHGTENSFNNPDFKKETLRALQDEIGRPMEESWKRLSAARDTYFNLEGQSKRTGLWTQAEADELYMRSMGEAQSRATEARSEMGDARRRSIFPMQTAPGAYDRPLHMLLPEERLYSGEALRLAKTLGTTPEKVVAAHPEMAIEQPPHVSASIARETEGDTSTLKTLERLPQDQENIPKRDIWRQLARPDVTSEEKDIFRYGMRQEPGETVPAKNLVGDVKRGTREFRLGAKDSTGSDDWADYGLDRIGRATSTSGAWIPEGATATEEAELHAEYAARQAEVPPTRTTQWNLPTEHGNTGNHFQNPNYFGHTRAFEEDGIPHVVELQSDLAQKAGKPLSEAEVSRLKEESGRRISWQTAASDAEDILHNPRSTFSDSSRALEAFFNKFDPEVQMDVKLRMGARFLEDFNKGSVTIGPEAEYMSDRLARTRHMVENPDEIVDELLSKVEATRNLTYSDADMAARKYERDRPIINEAKGALDILGAMLWDEAQVHELRSREITAKLENHWNAHRTEHLSPMFKNWERRLIREELGRAARAQPNPAYESAREQAKISLRAAMKDEAFYREGGLSERQITALTKENRERAEYFAAEALKHQPALPPKKVVRFADADTVAKVEGWATKEHPSVEQARQKLYAAEDRTTDLMGKDPTGSSAEYRDAVKEETALRQKLDSLYKNPPMAFQDQGHSDIYSRYADEVTNYLKSLGAKHVKDKHGHGWWEVPVKPQNKKVEIFGAAAGATIPLSYSISKDHEDER